MRTLLLILTALMAALMPAAALADDETDTKGFVMSIERDYVLPAGEQAETVVVIRANAVIDGVIQDTLVVIDGTATVNGTVVKDINVWSGDLILTQGAQANHIFLFRSEMTRDTAAVVTGDIDRESGFVFQGWAILFGILMAAGTAVAVLLAGQVFAAIGGQQLANTATTMRTHAGMTILTGVLTVILLPLAAALLIATIVGLPFGLGMLIFVLPTLAFLGYLVAGTWLGSLILRREGFGEAGYHPYREALLGHVVLGAVLFIPGLNVATFFIMGTWGVGAVMTQAWQAARAKPAGAAPVAGPDRPAATPPTMGTPVAGV